MHLIRKSRHVPILGSVARVAIMQADSSSLFVADPRQSMTAAVMEHLIIDGPEGPFKAVWFVQFNKEIRADANPTHEAHQYWRARTAARSAFACLTPIDVCRTM